MSLPYDFVNEKLHERRERVFLLFASIFLGSLTMLNILGITRFLNLAFFIDGSADWKYKLGLAVGTLPYPVTFLCTDFISEFYGRKRANFVVLVGFILNLWVVLILWVGGLWPGFEPPGEQGQGIFFEVRAMAFGAVTASMIAYLTAQLVDVQVFHFWKRLTKGRHLWLRNNGSTLVSQLVDTVAVVLITYYFTKAKMPVDDNAPLWPQLGMLVLTSYVFKLTAALVDTIPFYIGVRYLSRFLRIDPIRGREVQ